LKGTIARSLLESNAQYFKPYKLQKDGLKGVAIKGNHASVRVNFFATSQEQEHIAMALIHLSRTISKQYCREFVKNERQVLPIEIKLKGKANWDSTLISFKAEEAQDSAGNNTWMRNDSRTRADEAPVYFQCPKCTHVEHSACKAFQTHDLDRKQKCNACEVLSSVSLWKCSCKDFWHHCSTHRRSACQQHNPNIKREPNGQTAKTTSKQENAKRTRTIGPASFEDLLEEDLRRAKRKRDEEDEREGEPSIVLGKPISNPSKFPR